MEALHVLSTTDFSDEQLNRLRAVSPRLQIVQYTTRNVQDVPASVWSEVDVLGTTSVFPLPDHAPHLRWVQVFSAGVEHALAHPFFRPEITLTNASGLHAVNVAELVSFEGLFAEVLQPGYFSRVRVNAELGSVGWPNGADLDPDVLYARITGEPMLGLDVPAVEESVGRV